MKWNEFNIKWMIAIAICVVFVTQSLTILLRGTESMQELLLIEMFAIINIMVGFYWGRSIKKKEDESEE